MKKTNDNKYKFLTIIVLILSIFLTSCSNNNKSIKETKQPKKTYIEINQDNKVKYKIINEWVECDLKKLLDISIEDAICFVPKFDKSGASGMIYTSYVSDVVMDEDNMKEVLKKLYLDGSETKYSFKEFINLNNQKVISLKVENKNVSDPNTVFHYVIIGEKNYATIFGMYFNDNSNADVENVIYDVANNMYVQ